MSKRCELQKEYYKENGNYKGEGKYTDDYVAWLEDKLVKNNVALGDVMQQRELLQGFHEWETQLTFEEHMWYQGRYTETYLKTLE